MLLLDWLDRSCVFSAAIQADYPIPSFLLGVEAIYYYKGIFLALKWDGQLCALFDERPQHFRSRIIMLYEKPFVPLVPKFSAFAL